MRYPSVGNRVTVHGIHRISDAICPRKTLKNANVVKQLQGVFALGYYALSNDGAGFRASLAAMDA